MGENNRKEYTWPMELPQTAEDWQNVSNFLKSYFESIMRPAADAAIAAREKAADTNNAETDADAAARGMLGSTFVSSLKSRENQAAQSDIAGIETEYMASVAGRLYDALTDLQKQVAAERQFEYQLGTEREKMDMQREQFDKQYEWEREKFGKEYDWEREKFERENDWEREKFGKQYDWEREQFNLQYNLDRDEFELKRTQQADELELKRNKYKDDRDLDRERLALQRDQLELQREKMERQYPDYGSNTGSSSSGSKNSTKSGSSSSKSGNKNADADPAELDYEQCFRMLELLGDEAYDFFYSNDAYWRECREEVRAALSDTEYASLMTTFGKKKTTSGSGRSNGGGTKNNTNRAVTQ